MAGAQNDDFLFWTSSYFAPTGIKLPKEVLN